MNKKIGLRILRSLLRLFTHVYSIFTLSWLMFSVNRKDIMKLLFFEMNLTIRIRGWKK